MIKFTFLKNYFGVSVKNRLEQITLEKEGENILEMMAVFQESSRSIWVKIATTGVDRRGWV